MSQASNTTPTQNWWHRFWRLLRDFEEAMDTSPTDILHRRIDMLESEVAEIKASLPRLREIPAESERIK